ncbi:peptidase C15, pyroglutamyl peptidase I-like protein [Saitoella complicata NRRL Y-17804]|nr:peptidase C15, pyroglutamyl peptidase I-like protein [Saitoella complicata NRRL Y-17804]ODQ56015.1 peptidase C15, pyroglutamyl peptidase I-like protein [Saitoella complicata NRRL Y-17804]
MAPINDRTLSILITGFGPFSVKKVNVKIETNPSSELIRFLPDTIALPDGPDAPLTKSRDNHVSYPGLKAMVEKVYEEQEWDYIFHCGASAARPKVSIETRARRSGYELPDTDGLVTPGGFAVPKGEGEQEYATAIDVPALVAHLEGKGWEGKVQVSNDAGLYLCEWTYFHSLKAATGKKTKVLFIHVPSPGGELEWTHEKLSACVKDAMTWVIMKGEEASSA